MKTIGLFYAMNAAKTSHIAEKIREDLGGVKVIEVVLIEKAWQNDFQAYDNMIVGASTWFDGELPTYWDELVPELESLDLKGKKVAGPKGTILHELLVSYLNNAGMTEDDIEFMAMGIPDAQAALAGGSVDAALLAGPTAYNMEKDGFYIVTDGEGLTEATIVTATSEKFYEEHPELVKAFLTAQKQVLDEMDADHAAAVSATAKATGLEEAAVEEMYGLYDFDMEIKDSDIEAMEKTEKFMEDTGMIENPVDVASLILDVE